MGMLAFALVLIIVLIYDVDRIKSERDFARQQFVGLCNAVNTMSIEIQSESLQSGQTLSFLPFYESRTMELGLFTTDRRSFRVFVNDLGEVETMRTDLSSNSPKRYHGVVSGGDSPFKRLSEPL
jgi:hypothetical protein